MFKIVICDDNRTDVEMLECAFDKYCKYPIELHISAFLLHLFENCKIFCYTVIVRKESYE